MSDSVWFQTISGEQRQLLGVSDDLPAAADVAIVGAGIIGLATAYYLSRAGVRDICVLDRGPALGEASGANAGGLWFAQQSVELGPVAKLAAASSRLYEELAGEFDFDFERSGLLELFDDEEQAVEGEKRVPAALQAGFRVEKISGRSARSLEPALGLTPHAALYYPDEGHLNPVKLGLALAVHVRSSNVRLCFETEVRRLRPSVETSRGTLAAKSVVIACGAWTPQVTATVGWEPPIKPMRGTLLALEPSPRTLHHTIVTPSYYYWQLAEGHIAGGGSVDDVGFQRGVDPHTQARIRTELNRLLPVAAGVTTACSWSGFRPYCEDLRPVIGPVPGAPNTFVAAGHFKKGIMLAPVTGKILAELVTSGRSPLNIGPLSPDRFAVAKSP